MDNCHVILVDDDIEETVFLKDAMEATEKIVVLAMCCCYDELLSVLDETGKPDLIICDLHMPGKSGIEISKALENTEAYGDIPVLLISGSQPSPSVVNEVNNESNVWSILIKPFSVAGFNKLAEELLNICKTERVSGKVLSFD